MPSTARARASCWTPVGQRDLIQFVAPLLDGHCCYCPWFSTMDPFDEHLTMDTSTHVCEYFSTELNQILPMILTWLVLAQANQKQYMKWGVRVGRWGVSGEALRKRSHVASGLRTAWGSRKRHLPLSHQGATSWKWANLQKAHCLNPLCRIYLFLFIIYEVLAICLDVLVLKAS